MLYREKELKNAPQAALYVGRVSFGLKDAASGGLTAGDVSLKLLNATLEDAGDYSCYVSSEQGYDRASVHLIVTGECHESGKNTQKNNSWFQKNCLFTLTSNVLHHPPLTLFLYYCLSLVEVGTPPLLSTEWKEDNMVNVSCESEGWYPEPSLRWSDQNKVLTHKSLKYSKDPSGLLSVHSWLLVSGSSKVSCSVGLPDEEAKEARVRLENPPQLGKQGKENYLHVYSSCIFFLFFIYRFLFF